MPVGGFSRLKFNSGGERVSFAPPVLFLKTHLRMVTLSAGYETFVKLTKNLRRLRKDVHSFKRAKLPN